MITYEGVVYPWQCDHMGHLNVMWYVGKFDEATWNFLARFGLTGRYFRDAGRGMVAARQEITYRRELLPGDTTRVKTNLIDVGGSSVRFQHEMIQAETREVAAVMDIVGVHIDRAIRRPVPFPSEIAALLGAEHRSESGAAGERSSSDQDFS